VEEKIYEDSKVIFERIMDMESELQQKLKELEELL
jgi:hypothetical protein